MTQLTQAVQTSAACPPHGSAKVSVKLNKRPNLYKKSSSIEVIRWNIDKGITVLRGDD
jgi:hypothetical protein